MWVTSRERERRGNKAPHKNWNDEERRGKRERRKQMSAIAIHFHLRAPWVNLKPVIWVSVRDQVWERERDRERNIQTECCLQQHGQHHWNFILWLFTSIPTVSIMSVFYYLRGKILFMYSRLFITLGNGRCQLQTRFAKTGPKQYNNAMFFPLGCGCLLLGRYKLLKPFLFNSALEQQTGWHHEGRFKPHLRGKYQYQRRFTIWNCCHLS